MNDEVTVETETEENTEQSQSVVFPDTWREDYAGDDEGKLGKLSKYASPHAAFDAMISAQTKISSGDYKKAEPFPADGSDEDKAAWRTSNGIPEAPDKYEFNFENGLVIGEDDAPIIDDFKEFAHSRNQSPESVQTAIEWYYANMEKNLETQNTADKELETKTEDVLRAEWGDEYRAHQNRIEGLLDTAPEGVKDNLLNARFPDGSMLKSNPDAMKFMIDMALQINPATTLVPGAGDNIAGAISDELANLKTMMGDQNSEYWKGPKADAHQARYRELLEAQQRMKK